MGEQQLRLADLLAALSQATDLAMGQPPEKAIRTCVVAAETARAMNLPEDQVGTVYYSSLLKHLGCTASSHEEVLSIGPEDLEMRPLADRVDAASARESFELMRRVGRGTGWRRPALIVRAITSGKEMDAGFVRATCEVAVRMAERLGLGAEVGRALNETGERWDGRGLPRGLAGDDVSIAARLGEAANQAVMFHRLGGDDAMLAMLDRRSGGMLDPGVVEVLRTVAPSILDRLERDDPWIAVLEAEPQPARWVPPDRLDAVADAFADLVDLKSPFTLGHSSGVATLASEAAERLGLPDPTLVRRAGLLHDLGRTAVGTGVWERPGPLTRTQWEQVRLHPYQTERILARSVTLEPLARLAGLHHERLDGSGYHHGASAAGLGPEARLLAAADVYQALTQDRPHRPARSAPAAADELTSLALAGVLDPECVRAVVEAAGQPGRRTRTAWPAGLSHREVEVIRLLARGRSNRAIAEELVISPRTAEHHVQHIYAKIGASTRAAAAMFAMEHGILLP